MSGRWTLTKLDAAHGNTVIAGRNWFSWEAFDRLPRIVREVLAFAPVRLGCGRALEALEAGASAEAVARQEVAMARAFLRQETLLTYGPDHPQAPPPRTPRAQA